MLAAALLLSLSLEQKVFGLERPSTQVLQEFSLDQTRLLLDHQIQVTGELEALTYRNRKWLLPAAPR